MKQKNDFITTDFDEWRIITSNQYKHDLPDKIIFPEELKEHSSGYMLSPVGNIDGKVLMVVSLSTDSIKTGFDHIKNLSKDYDVLIYQLLWRHIKVDDYVLNSYIFKLSTIEKGVI